MTGLSGLLSGIGKLADGLGLPDPLGLGRNGADHGQDGADGIGNARGPDGGLHHEGQGHHDGLAGHDPQGNAYGNRGSGANGPNGPSANGGAHGQNGTQGAGQGQQPTFNPSSSSTPGSLRLPPLPSPPSPIVTIVQSVVALPGALITGLFQPQPPGYASQGSQDFARYSNNGNAINNSTGTVPPAPSPGNSAYGHAQGNGIPARTDGGLVPNALGTVREMLTTVLAPATASAATAAQAAAALASTMASHPVPLAATMAASVPLASNAAATLPGAPPLSPAPPSAQTAPAGPLATTATTSTPLANAGATTGTLASAAPAQQLVAPHQNALVIPMRTDAVPIPGQTTASMPLAAPPPPGQTALAAFGAPGATTAQAPSMAAIGNTAAVPLSQQAAVDARGLPLAASDRVQQNARADMAMIAGHTGESRQRVLRKRMMGTLTAPMSQLLAALASKDFPRTRRHLAERQQAAQDLERAMQWVFWVLATAAYGCLILAIVVFAAGSSELVFHIPEMRSYTGEFALGGLVAGACAWLLARRLTK